MHLCKSFPYYLEWVLAFWGGDFLFFSIELQGRCVDQVGNLLWFCETKLFELPLVYIVSEKYKINTN